MSLTLFTKIIIFSKYTIIFSLVKNNINKTIYYRNICRKIDHTRSCEAVTADFKTLHLSITKLHLLPHGDLYSFYTRDIVKFSHPDNNTAFTHSISQKEIYKHYSLLRRKYTANKKRNTFREYHTMIQGLLCSKSALRFDKIV